MGTRLSWGRVAFLIVIMLWSGMAKAMTVQTIDFVCPLCTTHFRQNMTTSGTYWGQRLDLLPVGNAPQPWSTLRCPKCNLVYYKQFTPRELKQLRTFIFSDEYRALVEKWRSTSYLIAKTREQFGAGHFELARTILLAACGESRKSAAWNFFMDESLRHFEQFLRTTPPRGESWAAASLLRGELLRQLGRLVDAEAHFSALAARSHLMRTRYSAYLAQEQQLIKAGDVEPHQLGEPSPQLLGTMAMELINKAPSSPAFLAEFDLQGAHVVVDDYNRRPSWLYVDRTYPAAPRVLFSKGAGSSVVGIIGIR